MAFHDFKARKTWSFRGSEEFINTDYFEHIVTPAAILQQDLAYAVHVTVS